VGKVSNNIIAIIEGEVTLKPSGRKVAAGFFARHNADGTIDVLPFDVTKEFDGKLMTFNGPLPGLPEAGFGSLLEYFTKLGIQDSSDRVNNLPSGVLQFNPPAKPTRTPTSKSYNPTPTARPATPVVRASPSPTSSPFFPTPPP